MLNLWPAAVLRRVATLRRLAAEERYLRGRVVLFSAFCCLSSLGLAQSQKPRVVVIHSAPNATDHIGTIVMPARTPLRLLSSLSPNGDIHAAFKGRFTLSGLYKLEGSGRQPSLTVWPDRKSRAILPHWQDYDVPKIDISNSWAFAKAVVPKDKLQKLQTGALSSVRGHVTIVADRYETLLDCEVVYASARFVSVVKQVEIAANPQEEETC